MTSPKHRMSLEFSVDQRRSVFLILLPRGALLRRAAQETLPEVTRTLRSVRVTGRVSLAKGLCIFNFQELGLLEPRSGTRVKPGADTSSAPGHEITSPIQPRRGVPFRACLLTVSTRTDRIEVAPPGLKPFVIPLCLGAGEGPAPSFTRPPLCGSTLR